MDRAKRRFHAERWKNKVKRYDYYRSYYPEYRREADAKSVGINARTRARCSNACCGNPRKFWKGEQSSFQEKKRLTDFRDQLTEIYEI